MLLFFFVLKKTCLFLCKVFNGNRLIVLQPAQQDEGECVDDEPTEGKSKIKSVYQVINSNRGIP